MGLCLPGDAGFTGVRVGLSSDFFGVGGDVFAGESVGVSKSSKRPANGSTPKGSSLSAGGGSRFEGDLVVGVDGVVPFGGVAGWGAVVVGWNTFSGSRRGFFGGLDLVGFSVGGFCGGGFALSGFLRGKRVLGSSASGISSALVGSFVAGDDGPFGFSGLFSLASSFCEKKKFECYVLLR